ncbi:uncharacterized protein LOC5502777 [Nematostella vectensis]|uniref:uncharacterized protein LOC5502777 n=1 Tax=Nematostella vectensis TaxID=45351 RepID=UPI0020776277|nr:uncharacterized protein LOC5502777 [Nematostella vectensis]
MEEPVSKYRVFLLQLAQQLTDEDCRGMKFLAADFIPRAKRDAIEGVLEFFCELEDCKRMNADNLDILKFLLMQLKHFALVKKVEEFELERRVFAQSLLDIRKKQSCNQDPNNNTIAKNSLEGDSSHGTHSHESRKHGELSARVVLELAGRGAWYLGCGYILNRYKDDPDTLAHLVTTVVLPTGILMKTLSKGSITIVFQANDLDALREFWKRYRDGTLRDALYRVLVTEELVQLAAKRTFVFKVEMDETEYRDALLDLLVVKLEANGLLKTIASSRSRRRSKSLPDMASLVLNSSRECPRDIHVTLASELKKRNSELWDILLKFGNRRITHELKREPATPRITFTSGEEGTLLNELLGTRLLQEISVCLDRKMAFGNDWRQLSSVFGYKMAQIRCWERQPSPTAAMLDRLAEERPGITTNELVNTLSGIDRNDVAVLLQKGLCASQTTHETMYLLVDLPFSIRRDMAMELDQDPEKFNNVVQQCLESLSTVQIECLRRQPSPTMAFLDQLEAKMPLLSVKSISDACEMSGATHSALLIDKYLMSNGAMIVKELTSASITNRLLWTSRGWHGTRADSVDSGIFQSEPSSP